MKILLKPSFFLTPDEQTFEFTPSSNNFTIKDLKQENFKHLHVPPQCQLLLCGGKILDNSYDASRLSSFKDKNNNDTIVIDVLIDPKFQSFQPPAKFRDSLGGGLLNQPTLTTTGKSFSKNTLDDWIGARHGAVDPFTRLPMGTRNKLNEDLNNELKNYLLNIPQDDMKISTLNSLGDMYAILESIKEYITENQPGITDHHRSDWGLDFIPAIVVLGDENSGKSSLSQRLTMLAMFPKDVRLCTSVVTIIRFRRGPYKPIQLRTFYHESGVVSHPIRLSAAVADSNIFQAMPHYITFDQHLEIEITAPNLPNLDFFDYPGCTATGENGPIIGMLEKHVTDDNHRSMYLYTINAIDENKDSVISNARRNMSEIFTKFPEIIDRTVAVFTQTDRASKERLSELQTLPTSHPSIIGVNLPWRHVLTAAHLRGHESYDESVMNTGDNVGQFFNLENQAKQEYEYFETNKIKGGCNKLISIIKSMHLTLLGTYIQKTTNKLQTKTIELTQSLSDIGDLEAHEFDDEEKKSKVCDRFVNDASEALKEGWSNILNEFEDNHIEGIRKELMDKLQQKVFQTRADLDTHLREEVQKPIRKLCESCFESENEFWFTQIYKVLFNDKTSFKMNRFDAEIEVVAKYIQSIASKYHEEVKQKLNKFIDLHFNNFSGSIHIIKLVDQTTNNKTFTLKFNDQLAELLVHILSTTLSCFSDGTLFSKDHLKSLLHTRPFIESTKGERYKTLQKLELLKIASNNLSMLQDEIKVDLIGDDNTNEERKE